MRWRRAMLLSGSALAAVSLAELGSAQEPGATSPPATTAPAAPGTAAPMPEPGTAPPPPPRSEPAKTLPTIAVQASRPKPKPARPAATGTPPAGVPTAGAPAAAAPPPAPTPYETGAPSVGGGAPVTPQLASQMTVSGADINARPLTRPGEVVEAAPGLIATVHSDGGKANQYYLRGWNLDHGTDLATFVDDVPINLPSNVHGQGYTDLNWLIPETIGGVEIRKGPYFADIGDFQNAGNLHIALRDGVDRNIVSVTAGSFGYLRYLALGSTKVDGGGSLLYAGEFTGYNGPWSNPDDMRKFSGLLRYSQGTATDGFSVTAAAYTNRWNAADQIPLRGITTGAIGGLYGEIDPTDGGDSSRFALSGRMAQSDANGSWKANAFVVRYTMDLFNNFAYFTNDPVNGDQFHQHEERLYAGAGASRTFDGTLFARPSETVLGLQTRYDGIKDGLSNTFQRQLLANTLLDQVELGTAAIYAQNTVRWTDWFRTTTGWRGDTTAAKVDSWLQPANSGRDQMTIGSPKITAALGPFHGTELFAGAGMGYHSNDARGAVVTEVPGAPGQPESATPLLVRSRGGEVGLRTKAIPNLDSSISFFYLHQDSELFYDGDTGTTAAGLPSQRTGLEITNNYTPVPWLKIDGDLALSRARFLGFDTGQDALYRSLAGYPQAQIGNAPGNFVFNAPWMVASAGITLGDKTGWFSSLRWRYFSSRPLTEDGAFQSPPFNLFNGAVGYRFDNGWRIQLDALNLLNSTTDQATYAYGSLLTGDNLFARCHGGAPPPAAVCQNGVMDYVLHPAEPLAFRLTLAGPIETVNVPAMAAELKQAMPEYRAPQANYDWTGFYLGAHVDAGWSRTTSSAVDTATGAAVQSSLVGPSDQHGGLQFGYDYMTPSRVVLGIAGDVSSGGRKTTTITDASGVHATENNVFDSETARLRLGYACDNVLLYGTGGLAWSNNQYVRAQLSGTLNTATAGTAEAVNTYLAGWTAGGGIAFAFAQNWNAFAEYRHTDYGSTTLTLPFSRVSETAKNTVSEVEFGLNYKFNASDFAGRSPARNPPAPAPPRDAPSGAFSWTGLYAGIDGGYGWGTSSGALSTVAATDPYGYGVSGPRAGTFVGGNYQINRFVVGVEADRQWSTVTGNSQAGSAFGTTGALPQGPFTVSTTLKNDGSVRGRLGVAFDRFLTFGTAGWAWGTPSTAYAAAGSAPFFTHGGASSGWTAGAGLDYAITDSVFGRIEYRYTSLVTAGFAAGNAADTGNKTPVNDFRVGLAYKFDGIPFGDKF